MNPANSEKSLPIGSQVSSNSGGLPFFSIGVTTYNRNGMLKQTLLSICRQTFTDFEVIVGNDYVPEPISAEILGINDPRIRYENYPENLGEERNMNTLLEISRGRYFTWQCDDDLYAPNFLEEVFALLTQSNFPFCVFTSYKIIHGEAIPDNVKTASGQGQIFSGRKFLHMYWSAKLKAMGCTGVYKKEYLKELGGVQGLADTRHPLYSEYLLLNQVGLQEQVAHINEPLLLYRIHDESWGCTLEDIKLFERAGENLVLKSLEIFSNPKLRDDFSENITSILKFAAHNVFIRLDGVRGKFKIVSYLLALKRQFSSLKGTKLYWIALFSCIRIGISLIWQVFKLSLQSII